MPERHRSCTHGRAQFPTPISRLKPIEQSGRLKEKEGINKNAAHRWDLRTPPALRPTDDRQTEPLGRWIESPRFRLVDTLCDAVESNNLRRTGEGITKVDKMRGEGDEKAGYDRFGEEGGSFDRIIYRAEERDFYSGRWVIEIVMELMMCASNGKSFDRPSAAAEGSGGGGSSLRR